MTWAYPFSHSLFTAYSGAHLRLPHTTLPPVGVAVITYVRPTLPLLPLPAVSLRCSRPIPPPPDFTYNYYDQDRPPPAALILNDMEQRHAALPLYVISLPTTHAVALHRALHHYTARYRACTAHFTAPCRGHYRVITAMKDYTHFTARAPHACRTKDGRFACYAHHTRFTHYTRTARISCYPRRPSPTFSLTYSIIHYRCDVYRLGGCLVGRSSFCADYCIVTCFLHIPPLRTPFIPAPFIPTLYDWYFMLVTFTPHRVRSWR